MIRVENRQAVMDFLGTRTLSVREIQKGTGLAYNTVKVALRELAAESFDTYPKTFRMRSPEARRAALGASIATTTNIVSVDLVTRGDEWVPRWNEGREMVGKNIAKIVLDPRADARELASRIATAASTLASLSFAIHEVSDKPDWFQLLGGTLDD